MLMWNTKWLFLRICNAISYYFPKFLLPLRFKQFIHILVDFPVLYPIRICKIANYKRIAGALLLHKTFLRHLSRWSDQHVLIQIQFRAFRCEREVFSNWLNKILSSYFSFALHTTTVFYKIQAYLVMTGQKSSLTVCA